jgi:lipopolysaccharide export system protein LptA
MMKRALATGLLLAFASTLWAAKADRQRPLIIDGGEGSLKAQVQGRVELEGPVRVSKGTLQLRATRLLATEQRDGSHRLEASSSDGTPVQFSQALDRPGETMEAVADRLEYEEGTGIARFLGNARLRLLSNGQMQQELTGSQIVFDTLKEEVLADGKPVAQRPGEGGVRIILMPKAQPATPAVPASAVPLQTTPALTPKPAPR